MNFVNLQYPRDCQFDSTCLKFRSHRILVYSYTNIRRKMSMSKNITSSFKFIKRFPNYPNSIRFSNASAQHSYSTTTEIENEEVQIPVPWGKIACVRWGPKDKQPILALHGWQDNAGTWKPLIPLLPPGTSVLAIDNPGHGHSSWYPNGIMYNFIDNPIILRRIVKYFGWQSISLLGHSMGAITSFVYGSLYPNEVKNMILIDNLKPTINNPKTLLEKVSSGLDKTLKADDRNINGGEPPSYSFEELIERLHLGSGKSIDKSACHYLLERAIQKSSVDENKYYFKRDSRLKHNFQFGSSQEHTLLMASQLKCPILHIKFESAPYFERKEYYTEVVNSMKESNKLFEVHMLPGTHHGHLNTPHLVAPLINDFMKKYEIV